MSKLAHSKIFSAIDGAGAFHQIAIRSQDKEKTAFHTPFGLYQFKRMPFGLTNAPATFQALMNEVLQEFVNQFLAPLRCQKLNKQI